ncbi:MAG: hypothetical protein KDD53_03580, partial [Bdellovibrionales bacterium]|nr:hypothetical protein [Bdellovibrionales bacterium]
MSMIAENISSKVGEAMPKSIPLVAVITVLLAACSILYELIVAQTMSLLAANTVVWYSVSVGLFLLGMGIGSFISDKIAGISPWIGLAWLEVALSILGALSVALVHVGHMLYSFYSLWGEELIGRIIFFGLAFTTVLLVGLLSGIELPLLIRIGRMSKLNRPTSTILGLDYIGSLVGAILFPIFFLPRFELTTIALIVALANLALAALAALRSSATKVHTVVH